MHRGPAGTDRAQPGAEGRLNPGRARRTASTSATGWSRPPTISTTGSPTARSASSTAIVDGSLDGRLRGRAGRRAAEGASDLVHGWAITVHRAQGSEWPAVVAVMPPEAGGMLSRPLVYTALTRAQRHLSVVHAAGPALARGVARSAPAHGGPGSPPFCAATDRFSLSA